MGRRSNRMTRLRPEAMRAANPVACCRPRSGRLRVATLLEDLVDALLRKDFQPDLDDLDPLLSAWQHALGSETGVIDLGEEDAERLSSTSLTGERASPAMSPQPEPAWSFKHRLKGKTSGICASPCRQ